MFWPPINEEKNSSSHHSGMTCQSRFGGIFQPRRFSHGCKTDTVFQGCATCPVRKCAKKKSGIESCLDCEKYPCLLYKIAKIVIAVQRLEKKLPHLKCKSGNLAVIREKGMNAWLEEQQRVWECPDCHASFSWYQTQCSQCGKLLHNSNAWQTSQVSRFVRFWSQPYFLFDRKTPAYQTAT